MTGAVITIAIILILVGGSTAGVISYFRLQRHRADAVAMAHYRKLAEQSTAQLDVLQDRLSLIDGRLKEIESLLRSVG
ncbi:hypothetical protein ACIQM4_00880 [Streptomyces sp. NPDC091272]|uniref:hypothetical protein n=1 Tax=Streptomyces sp. NPDC091272 TaxID=3365981 RepID=UPI00380AD5CC